MSDIHTLYPEATRLVHAIQHSLRLLEEGGQRSVDDPRGAFTAAGPDDVGKLLNSVSRDINALSHHVTSLQARVARQMEPRRDLWRTYVSQRFGFVLAGLNPAVSAGASTPLLRHPPACDESLSACSVASTGAKRTKPIVKHCLVYVSCRSVIVCLSL